MSFFLSSFLSFITKFQPIGKLLSNIHYLRGIDDSINIKNLIKNKSNLVIVGASSWGPGQLEGEMERDDWILSEIKKDLISEGNDLDDLFTKLGLFQ